MGRRPRFWFDEEEADRNVRFFEEVLRHTEGRWAGAPFILDDWQRDEIIRPLFGWMRFDEQTGLWVRRYSRAWVEIPRGNGKTEIAAGVVLQGLAADGEYGAEVYSGAEDRDQAEIVYRPAAEMVRMSPTLRKRLKIVDSRKRILDPRTNSFFQVLPRDQMGTGAQGFKVHRGVIDEVHVQKTKHFMNAMKKGLGKRRQAMLFMITTAGDDPKGPAGEEHEYALKVLEDPDLDPTYFVYVKAAPPEAEADPFNEKYWRIANPALGDKKKQGFLSIQTLREEATEARVKPSELNDFLRFRLNLWVRRSETWIPLDRYRASAGLVAPEKLKGKTAYGGLHLAASTDLVAWVLDFPTESGHQGIFKFWAPKDREADLSRRTMGQSDAWIREGFLDLTPGDVIDYSAVKQQLVRDAKKFDIEEIGYHRWGMTQLSNELQDEGLDIVPVSTAITSISPATKELERLVYQKRYLHGGNPVMEWMIMNAVTKTDSDKNIKIDAEKSKESVVGPIAAVMALDRAIRQEQVRVAIY